MKSPPLSLNNRGIFLYNRRKYDVPSETEAEGMPYFGTDPNKVVMGDYHIASGYLYTHAMNECPGHWPS